MLIRVVLLSGLFLMAPAVNPAQTSTSPEAQVHAALADFIRAFDNLGWERFRLAFDDNATVFYPRGFPARAKGRRQFEENFRRVFEQIRGAKTSPPYMNIEPKDLDLQMFGDVAVATFHLDDRVGFLNRRTLVLTRTKTGWKIIHLHASEVATSSTQR
jgi:ketosteroid isomerase-like protein